ncbi:MAG: RnfABCDGE type electron transport complex subunit G [Candidatus Aegiribacteria sp.]|nr:RnfABCDGE type electron transport complex subunit G [Candidatus Aegiribacteria sp.]
MIEMLKLGLVLMLVALIAAVALGLVNSRTAPLIEIQQELEKQNAMSEAAASLMPDDSLAFDSLSIDNLENPYSSCDELLQVVKVFMPPDTSRIGYVFIAYGKGYSSTIQTMVATRMDGRVSGTIILNQQETPGLGANIVKPSRLIDHLIGMTGHECLLKKDGGTIDAMTGCTITSRTVVNSVRQGLENMNGAGLFSDEIALDEEHTEGGAE